MNYPFRMLALCAALTLGEACGFAVSRFASLWPLAAFAALLLGLAVAAFPVRGGGCLFVAALGFALALAAAASRAEVLAEAEGRSDGTPFVRVFRVEGAVRVLESAEGRRWASFASSAGSVRVRVVMPLEALSPPPAEGASWGGAGWLERCETDDPSRRRALWVKGSGTFARREAGAVRGAFAARLAGVRAELSRRMGIGLSEPRAADLNRAILLGERLRLEKDERDAFAAAGTIHIFAISGLHVMMVADTLVFLLALCAVPVRLSGLVVVPLLWLYVAMTGGNPSAVRAAAMASLRLLAPVWWRRPDGLVAWSLTYLAVYGADPMKLHDVGCALSFAVMLGLVFWSRFAREFIADRRLTALVVTLSAWAVGAPIVAHAFGRITPGGIFANLLLVPAADVSVKAGIVGIFASCVSVRLAAYVNNFAALVTETMSGLSRVVASVPGADLEVAPWSAGACIAWYLALALLLWLLRTLLLRRRRTL